MYTPKQEKKTVAYLLYCIHGLVLSPLLSQRLFIFYFASLVCRFAKWKTRAHTPTKKKETLTERTTKTNVKSVKKQNEDRTANINFIQLTASMTRKDIVLWLTVWNTLKSITSNEMAKKTQTHSETSWKRISWSERKKNSYTSNAYTKQTSQETLTLDFFFFFLHIYRFVMSPREKEKHTHSMYSTTLQGVELVSNAKLSEKNKKKLQRKIGIVLQNGRSNAIE